MGQKTAGRKRNWAGDNRAAEQYAAATERFFRREEVLADPAAANAGKAGAPFRVPDRVIAWAVRQIADLIAWTVRCLNEYKAVRQSL